ncbi:hypothetical protein GCM10007927_09230 [Sulfitobacter pacificus]|uniref:Secreted protein n=1 Tax=Sulfitobacter pacificus TaxID=1499314 RepID=A0ABQ5VGA0_9RHOB|nr:hypothetical protein GCM10007927_09230 [Sulfitobacter pacificus]
MGFKPRRAIAQFVALWLILPSHAYWHGENRAPNLPNFGPSSCGPAALCGPVRGLFWAIAQVFLIFHSLSGRRLRWWFFYESPLRFRLHCSRQYSLPSPF